MREQREAYTRLQRTEAEFRRVLQSVSDCLWSAHIDEAGKWSYQYFSPVVLRITGQPAEYFLKGPSRWRRLVHPEDRARWQDFLQQLAKGKSGQEEYRLLFADGSSRWVRESVQVSTASKGNRARLDGVLTDITNRKKTEDELKKTNDFLDSIIENVPLMLFVKEPVGLRFHLINKVGQELLGFPREQLIGKNDYDFFPPEEAEFFIGKDREVLEGRKLVDIPEETIQTTSGYKVLHTMKIPLLDENGEPRFLVGISEDITARKALEETKQEYDRARERYAAELEAKHQALVESEKRYRQLTEATLDSIVVADRDGRILLFNPAAERLFGHGAADILGTPLAQLFAPRHQKQFAKERQDYLETGKSQFVGRTVELNGRRKDDSEFPLELALSVLDGGADVKFLAAIRDLTERNRLRTTLTQNEKLASIGRLTAGLAHEINNPVAYVANNLTVLERDAQAILKLIELYGAQDTPPTAISPERAREIEQHASEIDLPYIRENLDPLLRRTREGLDRVTRIIKSMRGYSRNAPAKRQEVSLPDLVSTSLEIIQGTLKKRAIEVEQRYDEVPKISCVFSDINQVVLNLLINACHAIESMPAAHRGKIRIAVRSNDDDQVLEVADNGCGIPPEAQSHLFDPFFTTKDVDQGSGLGLWICHNVVTAHGGKLEVNSEAGTGTTFRVVLPRNPPIDAPLA
jgi:PAS domain S-box-containing protein